MPDPRLEESSIFNLQSILFALFKHKRLVLIAALVGLLAAAAFYFLYPAVYASQAKLLVRYVIDRSGVDAIEGASSLRNGQGGGVIGSEVEILGSWDLAMQVAQALGPKRILPDAARPTVEEAAAAVTSGLELMAGRDTNIISVTYKNNHPEVAVAALNELVNRYFIKHLEVHRSAGAFDFVSQQTDQVRARLNQTEDALKALKGKAGILSLNDSTTAFNTDVVRLDEESRNAESELAEQDARVRQLSGEPAAKGKEGESSPAPSPSATASNKEIEQYEALVARLTQVRQTALEMSSKYTSANVLVKMNQAAMADLESQKRGLEKKYPELGSKAASGAGSSATKLDFGSERARLAGLKAKVDDLRNRRSAFQEKMKQLGDVTPQIATLERERELQEANYKYFQGTLEKARVDEALDPSKMPNISAVQRPSPPMRVTKTRNKGALMLAGGGLALGLLSALFLELLVHRSFKRRAEIESFLRAPVMLSIPEQTSGKRRRLPWKNGSTEGEGDDNGKTKLAPWDPGHFIRPYSEAIRDRLGLYFELNGVTHKPKLVGVTGFGEGSGVSTLAAGVAAALSETGDGKVLLVDVNASNGEAHPFFAGRPAASLTKSIEPSAPITSAVDNLYLATVGQTENRAQLGLKKFFALVPNLKASDFDYIIFDMPPLNQTSPTIGLSALMDKVLLVVPSEDNQRDAVKRGYDELVAARADVSVVLNKTRSYAPKWIDAGS